MKYLNENIIPLLLSISFTLLLVTLIGGDIIDNRDFSHINPEVLLTLSLIRLILCLGSVALVWYTLQQSSGAFLMAVIVGFSNVFVYLLDLLGIFPSTPALMSDALFFIDVLGLLIGILTLFYAGFAYSESEHTSDTSFNKAFSIGATMTVSFLISGTLLVGFALPT